MNALNRRFSLKKKVPSQEGTSNPVIGSNGWIGKAWGQIGCQSGSESSRPAARFNAANRYVRMVFTSVNAGQQAEQHGAQRQRDP
jgi:hypothetical protein